MAGVSDWVDRLANKLQGYDLASAMRRAIEEHIKWSRPLGLQVDCARCGSKAGEWCGPTGSSICHRREHDAAELRRTEHSWE